MHCARCVGLLGTPGHLEYKALRAVSRLLCNRFLKLLAVSHPPKATGGEKLTHGPTIEIVHISVENVAARLFWVVAIDQRIVGFGMAL